MLGHYWYWDEYYVRDLIEGIKRELEARKCIDEMWDILHIGFFEFTLIPPQKITRASQVSCRRPVNNPVQGRNY